MPRYKPQRVLASLALTAALAGMAGCGGSLTRAQDALAIGNEAEAEKHLRKAVKHGSTQAEASKLLSQLLAKRGDHVGAELPKDAEGLYREALALDENNENARLGLARLLIKRGFMTEANQLLAKPGCFSCGRLVGMMVHQNAENTLATGDILGARALYQQAFEEGNDPLDALGIVRTYLAPAQRDLDKAKEYLATAAPLIASGQIEAERIFQELRVQLLGAAAAARNNEMVEAVFKIKTPILQDEPEFDLRFRISQAQFRNGDSDPAIERVSYMLESAGQYLDPTQREVMNAALVVMYSARVAQFLQAGDPVGAAKDIAAGLKIDANNSRLKLQQVLAIAANRLPLAWTELEKIPKGKDKQEVEAILHAQQVLAYLDENKMPKAYEELDKAQRINADLPEVRLARAYVLAESRNEDIKKTDDMRDARKLGAVNYPKGRINQYASALANLSRAKARVREQGVLHPFRGPGFDTRLNTLKAKIAEFYPYEVEWYAAKGGMIEIIAEAGQKTVEYSGPRWLKGSAIASPNSAAEIPVPNVGLVYLDHDGTQLVVVVEENAHIKVKL